MWYDGPSQQRDQQQHWGSSTQRWISWRQRHFAILTLLSVAAVLVACTHSEPAETTNTATSQSNSANTANTTGIATPNPADLANYNGTTRAQRDKMDPGEYIRLPEAVRAADDAETFNVHLPSAWNDMQQYLTGEERQVMYMPDLKKPRAQWSDQDYLNYHSLLVYLATSQKIDNPSNYDSVRATVNEELRELMIVAYPGSPPDTSVDRTYEYDSLNNQVTHHPGQPMKDINRAITGPENRLSGIELTNIQIGRVTFDNNGGRMVMFQSISDSAHKVDTVFYKNYADAKGNIVTTDEYVYDGSAAVSQDVNAAIARFAPPK